MTTRFENSICSQVSHRDCRQEYCLPPPDVQQPPWPFAESRFEGERYQLTVLVNDVKVKVLQIDQTSVTQRIDVPNSLLRKGKQRIAFQLTGRGRYAYQCILGGFVPADKLKSTSPDWEVRHVYEPAPLEVDGREIDRGFTVLRRRQTTFRNPLTQLPIGRRGLVRLFVRQNVSNDIPAVITEPIPSGTTVIEKSVTGPFERFEITPGAITFYVGNRRSVGTIRYELYGYLPGQYRAGPTVIRNAYRPEQLAVSKPKLLAVLPPGAETADQYRLTPNELYELGKYYFGKNDAKMAGKYLTELIDNWSLLPNAYKNVVGMLLDVHIETGSPAQVVRFFEIVVEKWPEQQIPFDQSLKIAAAYHEMGEYERSYLSFRATIEASFMQDSGMAGVLQSRGEFTRSVEVMQRLLREYPPEPYAVAAEYGLAQRVYAKAAGVAGDAKLRREKVNRVDLIHRASKMLENFLTAYPDDPAADRAAFAKANTLLDLEEYERAAAACDRYAGRYPDSKLLDSFWYIIGYCRFAGGQHEAALQMCRKVAEATRTDAKTGFRVKSPNKWQAIYIMGQIYHSMGRVAEAIAEYRRVEDRFDDAKRSIHYFLRKAISLKEVTTVRPGEPAQVELEFRNIAACEAKVYRIDLMKFTLLKRSLGGITNINLAGIRPIHETTIELGDGRDYRDRTHTFALPLEKEGAYLVVCRGDNLHASGLVLVTLLAVEVQHDAVAAQVRATVKDAVADRYLSDVDVKVIGRNNADFVSGSTDLRGVFVANRIHDAPTVIAQAGPGRYAFFRSPSGIQSTPRMPRMSRTHRMSRMPAEAMLERMRMHDSAQRYALSPSENEKRINQALDSPTTLECIDTPLQNVVDHLKELHGIEIQLDIRSLEDVGIDSQTPITRTLRGISLRSALKLLLGDLDLTHVIQNEVLLITTPEEEETFLRTVVYSVSDFAYRDKSGERWVDFDLMTRLITSTIQPETWDDVGGPGSVAPMEAKGKHFIVIRQTQDIHREIAALLAKLSGMAGRETTDEELPLKEKPERLNGGMMGGMGGGGMGGGTGGFGFGTGGTGGMRGMSGAAQMPSMGSELLKGLQDANKQLQQQQVDQIEQIHKHGGVGAGGFF